MATRNSSTDVIGDAIPFVVTMLLWIVITAIVYGVFVLVWPPVPDGEPWVHLGVYLLPVIGYLGHTLQQARKRGHA